MPLTLKDAHFLQADGSLAAPAGATMAVTVMADQAGLARCLALTAAFCQTVGLCDDDAHSLRLAVDEACTNVVSHAYAGDQPGPMALAFWARPADAGADGCRMQTVEAQIADQGKPFDPATVRAPDLSAALEERPVGGLGWFFITQVMTGVDYRSTPGGINCLTLTLQLSRP